MSLRPQGRPNDSLSSSLYNQLHKMADQYMRFERPGHTLQTTALIHEAFIRLGVANETVEKDEHHYLRLAARAMRRVLIDYARYERSLKREEVLNAIPFEDTRMEAKSCSADIFTLDNAMIRLSNIDPRLVEIVELRFFGGLTIGEVAQVLKISPSTVKRDWRMAKAWLKQELKLYPSRAK